VGRAPPAKCTSAALSAANRAEVQVACPTDQFVDIAVSGNPFLGAQAAAFRYVLDASGFVPADLLLKKDLNGTITSLRVYNASAEDGPLEMLVSF